jgi:hypothetical protein
VSNCLSLGSSDWPVSSLGLLDQRSFSAGRRSPAGGSTSSSGSASARRRRRGSRGCRPSSSVSIETSAGAQGLCGGGWARGHAAHEREGAPEVQALAPLVAPAAERRRRRSSRGRLEEPLPRAGERVGQLGGLARGNRLPRPSTRRCRAGDAGQSVSTGARGALRSAPGLGELLEVGSSSPSRRKNAASSPLCGVAVSSTRCRVGDSVSPRSSS